MIHDHCDLTLNINDNHKTCDWWLHPLSKLVHVQVHVLTICIFMLWWEWVYRFEIFDTVNTVYMSLQTHLRTLGVRTHTYCGSSSLQLHLWQLLSTFCKAFCGSYCCNYVIKNMGKIWGKAWGQGYFSPLTSALQTLDPLGTSKVVIQTLLQVYNLPNSSMHLCQA